MGNILIGRSDEYLSLSELSVCVGGLQRTMFLKFIGDNVLKVLSCGLHVNGNENEGHILSY